MSMNYEETPDGLSRRVLERDGCPLHYWMGGPATRPCLVWTHGATLDHRMFNPQATAFRDAYRILVWDERGHGRSRPAGKELSLQVWAEDLLAVLDDAGIETAVLAGQSLGGMIVQEAYRIAPQRAAALIMIDTVPIARAYSPLEVWALRRSLALFRYWPYENLAKWVAYFNVRDRAAQAYVRDAMLDLTRAEFLAIWQGTATAVTVHGLPGFTLNVPLLMAHGERDLTGTIRRDALAWARREPDAVQAVIPNARHNANQDNPRFFNAVVRRFVQQRLA